MRPQRVELSEEARAAPVRGRDRDPRPYFRERCAALLKRAAGQSARQVTLGGLGRRRKPATVRGWRAGIGPDRDGRAATGARGLDGDRR